jgi:hypothetical protein
VKAGRALGFFDVDFGKPLQMLTSRYVDVMQDLADAFFEQYKWLVQHAITDEDRSADTWFEHGVEHLSSVCKKAGGRLDNLGNGRDAKEIWLVGAYKSLLDGQLEAILEKLKNRLQLAQFEYTSRVVRESADKRAEESQSRRKEWRDRGFGFLSGVVVSVFTALFGAYLKGDFPPKASSYQSSSTVASSTPVPTPRISDIPPPSAPPSADPPHASHPDLAKPSSTR